MSSTVPTMYYNGRSKDKKSLRVSINKRYLAIETKCPSSKSLTDHVSFIDWHLVQKIQFKQNRMKIVPTAHYPKIKAYFDAKVLKFLRKSCKKLGYLQPAKRSWRPGCRIYRPVVSKREHSASSASSIDTSISSSTDQTSMPSLSTDEHTFEPITFEYDNSQKHSESSMIIDDNFNYDIDEEQDSINLDEWLEPSNQLFEDTAAAPNNLDYLPYPKPGLYYLNQYAQHQQCDLKFQILSAKIENLYQFVRDSMVVDVSNVPVSFSSTETESILPSISVPVRSYSSSLLKSGSKLKRVSSEGRLPSNPSMIEGRKIQTLDRTINRFSEKTQFQRIHNEMMEELEEIFLSKKRKRTST